jgi:HSP20 family protein
MSGGFSHAGKKTRTAGWPVRFGFINQTVITAQIFLSLIRSVHFVNSHSRPGDADLFGVRWRNKISACFCGEQQLILGTRTNRDRPKGSLKNNVTYWAPMHPVRPRCENSECTDIPAFSRLAGRASQLPKLRTYFFVNPKERKTKGEGEMELIKIHFGEEPEAIEAAVDKNLTDLYRSTNLLFSCSDCLWLPSMDMIDTPKEIVIISEIAGLEKEDLEVEITRRAVKVSGRRRQPASAGPATYRLAEINYGQFERVLYLPAAVDSNKISATYSNGLLTIRLAKQPEQGRYQVPIAED